jgi:acetyl-CoA C-acetyltransferase
MAVILAARRTAVVPRNGAFARLSLEDLAAPVVLACLADAGLAAAEVSELICANAIGPGGNPARRIALAAGLPQGVAGLSTDRQCAGGLDAILLAKAMVDSGMAEVVIAGGAESHSRRPLRQRTDPDGGPAIAYEQAPFTPWPARDPLMGEAAAALADLAQISVQDQIAYAVNSHAKALAKQDWPEIVPLNGQTRDAFARALTPAVAARAPQIAKGISSATTAVAADAAAFCVVASDRFARAGALRLEGGQTLGAQPEQPGLAPIPAIKAVLAKAGMAPKDLALAEVMEAYAVQAIACIRGTGLEEAIVNPGGGALSRGHPIGASGAILMVRLFHGLRQGRGLAAIASAGGVATAVLVRRS